MGSLYYNRKSAIKKGVYIMKKEIYDEIVVRADADIPEDIRLTYYLLTGAVGGDYCDLEVYGVEIDKELLSGKSAGREKKQIKNLFFKRSEAVGFLKKISENRVTPMELKYVIKEYIDDRIDAIVANNV